MPRQTQDTRPKEAGPKPPFAQGKQPPPGKEWQMSPKADHGEESYAGNNLLRDKVAIITGADSGIGRAVAIAFAREGADLVLSYLPEEEDDARETERWVKEAGRRAALVAGDVGKKRYCERLVQTATGRFGRLDVVVSNAALQRTYEDIEDVRRRNLRARSAPMCLGRFFFHRRPRGCCRRAGRF